MPTTKSKTSSATITKLNKKQKICKFKLSATTPDGLRMSIDAPQVLPTYIHALIRCAQWASASPDPARRPDAKPDYVFLDRTQLGQLKDQILMVLADYQNTGVTQCPKCHEPFPEVEKKCPKCGFDSFGFARAEGTRLEVAKRILDNLKVIATGFGPDQDEKEGSDG